MMKIPLLPDYSELFVHQLLPSAALAEIKFLSIAYGPH